MKERQLAALASTLVSRIRNFNQIGKTFQGNRDLYQTLGYKRDLHFDDYWQRYFRGGIAGRVVDAFPSATWRNRPRVLSESEEFNEAWTRLAKQSRIFHYMERVDRVAGIGHYGILVIGTTGQGQLSSPIRQVGGPEDVVFLAPYSEGNADIAEFNQDPGDPRFGFPEKYRVQPVIETEDRSIRTQSFEVHHSRAIHVADGLVEDEILGIPRMKRIWNYLDDLDKIVGGSSEAVWRTVDRGIQFDLDKDAELDSDDADNMSSEIDEFVHGFQRYLKTQGVTANVLGSEVPNPRGAFDIVVSLISGTTGIPKRVLLGAEAGQLASNQDERNFVSRVKERQQSFAEPLILRPFIDKMQKIGALPDTEYSIEWPDLSTMTKREVADVAARVGQSLANASKQAGMEEPIMDGDEFRKRFLDFGPMPLAEGPEDPLGGPGDDNAS